MTSDDLEREWRDAASLPDLLRLTRAFVLGALDTFPGWGADSLDEESDALTDTLLAANDAGLLTVASQPGRPFAPGHDGRAWGGRAFVGGFAAPDVVAQLARDAGARGLWLLEDTEGAAPFDVPVGLRDGTPYLVLCAGARAAELEIFEAALGRRAYAALSSCSLVWAVDPAWGRRDRLGSLFGVRRV